MIKASYPALSEDDKRAVAKRLTERRDTYVKLLRGGSLKDGRILLVGDRPGPKAPLTPGYHHTPFYAIKNCSGWLNALLHLEKIPEGRLVWVNAYDKDGAPTDYDLVKRARPSSIIALGGNAEKWLKAGGLEYIKTAHPQYWKRFRNKESYELINVLHSHLNLVEPF